MRPGPDFRWAALLFGPLWLLARGLWRPLIGYVVLGAAIVALARRYGWLGAGAAVAALSC